MLVRNVWRNWTFCKFWSFVPTHVVFFNKHQNMKSTRSIVQKPQLQTFCNSAKYTVILKQFCKHIKSFSANTSRMRTSKPRYIRNTPKSLCTIVCFWTCDKHSLFWPFKRKKICICFIHISLFPNAIWDTPVQRAYACSLSLNNKLEIQYTLTLCHPFTSGTCASTWLSAAPVCMRLQNLQSDHLTTAASPLHSRTGYRDTVTNIPKVFYPSRSASVDWLSPHHQRSAATCGSVWVCVFFPTSSLETFGRQLACVAALVLVPCLLPVIVVLQVGFELQ